MKAISYVFGTKELTSDNMTALKNQLDRLPPGLSETVIHLDQKRACPNCLRVSNAWLAAIESGLQLILIIVSRNSEPEDWPRVSN